MLNMLVLYGTMLTQAATPQPANTPVEQPQPIQCRQEVDTTKTDSLDAIVQESDDDTVLEAPNINLGVTQPGKLFAPLGFTFNDKPTAIYSGSVTQPLDKLSVTVKGTYVQDIPSADGLQRAAESTLSYDFGPVTATTGIATTLVKGVGRLYRSTVSLRGQTSFDGDTHALNLRGWKGGEKLGDYAATVTYSYSPHHNTTLQAHLASTENIFGEDEPLKAAQISLLQTIGEGYLLLQLQYKEPSGEIEAGLGVGVTAP